MLLSATPSYGVPWLVLLTHSRGARFRKSAHSSLRLLSPLPHGERCDKMRSAGCWGCHVPVPSCPVALQPRSPTSWLCLGPRLPPSCFTPVSLAHLTDLPSPSPRGSQIGHTVSLNLKYPQGAAMLGHKVLWSVPLIFFSFLRVGVVPAGEGWW